MSLIRFKITAIHSPGYLNYLIYLIRILVFECFVYTTYKYAFDVLLLQNLKYEIPSILSIVDCIDVDVSPFILCSLSTFQLPINCHTQGHFEKNINFKLTTKFVNQSTNNICENNYIQIIQVCVYSNHTVHMKQTEWFGSAYNYNEINLCFYFWKNYLIVFKIN